MKLPPMKFSFQTLRRFGRKILDAIGHLNNIVGLQGLGAILITAAGWVGALLIRSVPTWVILPFCLLSFIIGVAVGRITRKSATASKTSATPPPTARVLKLMVRGVDWYCTTHLGYLRSFVPACPKCGMEIVPHSDIHMRGVLNQPKVVLECERPGCGFRAEFLKMELSKFRSAVKREIEAELRKPTPPSLVPPPPTP